jgi:hypothetical protein
MTKARNKMPNKIMFLKTEGVWEKRWKGVEVVIYVPKSRGEVLAVMDMLEFCKQESAKRNPNYSYQELSMVKGSATRCENMGATMYSALFGRYITIRKKINA